MHFFIAVAGATAGLSNRVDLAAFIKPISKTSHGSSLFHVTLDLLQAFLLMAAVEMPSLFQQWPVSLFWLLSLSHS
jgi:hypothetical protein